MIINRDITSFLNLGLKLNIANVFNSCSYVAFSPHQFYSDGKLFWLENIPFNVLFPVRWKHDIYWNLHKLTWSHKRVRLLIMNGTWSCKLLFHRWSVWNPKPPPALCCWAKVPLSSEAVRNKQCHWQNGT